MVVFFCASGLLFSLLSTSRGCTPPYAIVLVKRLCSTV
ncbi:hypothetical protein HM1_1129 [Heliomicrobium modesticaldum Ice1]|uniref:Uncharacterized protein n=1 Tax=Heliobacterium modesticaldum (strain ATCC 51547 / Ice1) TaxID=498761 RepID=B0THK7_HELMI|nr:hypothetical protein HM1_1129 [Heliomicrobium modesticaldum Ice1]